jgi:hypothetical protein
MSVNWCDWNAAEKCNDKDTSKCVSCQKYFCRKHGEQHESENPGHKVPEPAMPIPENPNEDERRREDVIRRDPEKLS